VNDFKVTMLLADFAQAVEGKLYVLGGGWSVINSGPVSFAIAIYVQTAWHQANVRHGFKLELLDADGQPVIVSTPEGEKPLLIEGEFESGRPPGLKPGTPLDGTLAVNLAGVPLPADSRLEWRLSINGETHEDWTLPFTTRPAAAEQAA
jgi:hypothetical protein